MSEAITIRNKQSGAEATIAPDLGFNCIAFRVRIAETAIDVIDSPADVLKTDSRPSSFGIPILFPFPNRIRDGRFTWDGVEYEVPLAPGKPNAIHGFCLDRAWRIIDQGEDFVVGLFQLSIDDPDRRKCWPADFRLEVRYRVIENRLESQFRIENPDDVRLPWGLGTHPYFRLPLSQHGSPNSCVFTVPVQEEWELQENLPTGTRSAVPSTGSLRSGIRYGTERFDNVFTGWQTDGQTLKCSIADEESGIELTQACDARLFREAVVFTPPDRAAVCLEPYTCVTDAVNLQHNDLNTGWQVLDPGNAIETWVAIQVNRLLA